MFGLLQRGVAQEKTFTNSIGMEFVLIPAGEFMMGSDDSSCPQDDPFTEKNEYLDCLSNLNILPFETPRHKVVISKPFYIGKYEVTQLQWYKVMGNNPAYFKTEKVGMDSRNHPIESVSWDDVQEFLKKLNAMEKTNAYRLPTEAEWEYAARAGSETAYCFGNDESQLEQYAWYVKNSGNKTHPVGQLKPNVWGLYDMHGNVWEWTSDWHDWQYYSQSPAKDPQGPASGSGRVNRGGSWNYAAGLCRAARRYYYSPDVRGGNIGFRLVRTP